MKPLVSICVPLYNKVTYIERTLKALLAQTYPNLEIVINDNASNDGSGEIVQKFTSDSRVRYHRLNSTISFNEAWRYVLQLSKGDLLNLHGGDDWTIAPDWVEKMVAPLLADSSFGFSCCVIKIISELNPQITEILINGHRLITDFCKDLLNTPDRHERAQKILLNCLENRVGTPYTVMVRRECLPWSHWKKTSDYWPEAYADWDFMIRLFLNHKGTWVEGTSFDLHMNENSGFWKVVSRSCMRTALFDSMYRLMMPITILADPELADLRLFMDQKIADQLVNEMLQRLQRSLSLSNQLSRESK